MPLAKLCSGRMRIQRRGTSRLSGDEDSSLHNVSFPTPSNKGFLPSGHAQSYASASLPPPTPAACAGNNVERRGNQHEDGVAKGKSISNGKGLAFGKENTFGNGNEFRNSSAFGKDGDGNRKGKGDGNRNGKGDRNRNGNGNDIGNGNGIGTGLGIGLASANADASVSVSVDSTVNPIVTGQANRNRNGSSAGNGPPGRSSGGGPTNNGKSSGGSSSGPSSSIGEVTQPGSPKPQTISVPVISADTAGDIQTHASTNALSGGFRTSSDTTFTSKSDFHSLVANVASNPDPTKGAGAGCARSCRIHSSVPVPAETSDANTPGGGLGSATRGPGLNSGGGISASAIASIVVMGALVLFGVLVLVFFFFRKRCLSRPNAQCNGWRDRSGSATYGVNNELDQNSTHGSHNSRVSIASSFATTYDHSQGPLSSMDFALPPSPPIAEIRWDGIAPLMQTQLARNETRTRTVSPGIGADYRSSMHSVRTTDSGLSDEYSQYLLAVHSDLLSSSELLSPMSVRPFTPSESFTFPSPPISHSRHSGDWTESLRTPTSSITLATLNNTPRLSRRSRTPLPTIALVRKPFADPSNTRLAELAVIETVKKPHQPSQPGELRVAVAESVKVLRVLENAWALVEKIVPLEETISMTEETAPEPIRGLIPVECFFWETGDLSPHLAEKGSSGVYGESDDGLAVRARWK